MGKFVAWQFYWLFVIGLLIVAYFRAVPDQILVIIESYVFRYRSTIIAIGTVLLISYLALLTTLASNKSAELREIYNRKIQAQLKISEFRQDWITAIHEDMSTLSAELAFLKNHEDPKNVVLLLQRVLLQLDPNEGLTKDLRNKISAIGEVANDNNSEIDTDLIPEIQKICQKILKREWDRLKNDLEDSQIVWK